MHQPFEQPLVVEHYEDWFATDYGRLVDRTQTTLLLELLQPLAPGAALLDVGCGTGWFGAALRARGFDVVGVDPSRPMLERARRRFPVVCADAARLPFADRAFDAAFVIGVLDYAEHPVALLREARRVVRERVVVLALASGSYLALRRRLAGLRGHPIFSRARFHSRGRLLAFARAAGAHACDVRGALVLPPALAARAPALERRLSRHMPFGAGLTAFALPALGRERETEAQQDQPAPPRLGP